MALDFFDVTRNTTKTVLNAQGVLETVPANVPAFEFNTDGSYKGCLIEPAATNRLLRSEEFDNAYWSKLNLNLEDLGGGVYRASDTDDVSNTTHRLRRTGIVGISSVVRCLSIDIKPETISRFIFSRNPDGSNRASFYDLETQSTSGEFGAGIIPLEDGWFRIFQRGDNTSGSASRAFALFPTTGSDEDALSYTGDGNGTFLIRRAQYEDGVIPTSYIRTTDSTVTRNADVITKTDAADLIGQTEGTVYIEIMARANPLFRNVLTISDGTTDNRIGFSCVVTVVFGNFSSFMTDNAVSTTISSTLSSGNVKQAIVYKNGFGQYYANGQAVGAPMPFSFDAPLSVINIGHQSGTGVFNDHIRSVALYKRALSEQEAITLTQV